MDNNYENIVPWNGANDTGKDVRLKLERNFKKIGVNFEELVKVLSDKISKIDDDEVSGITHFLNGIKVGDTIIDWDSENKALRINESVYSIKGISALGSGPTGEGVGLTEEILADWLINNGYIKGKNLRALTDTSGNIIETKTAYLERVPKTDRYIGLEVVLKAEASDTTYTKFAFKNGIENYDFIGVEYFIDIKNYLYDGLDYEGDDKALSARQGKTLRDMIGHWISGTY